MSRLLLSTSRNITSINILFVSGEAMLKNRKSHLTSSYRKFMDSVELANFMIQLTSGDWEVDIINRGEILLHVLAENDLVLWSAAALRGEFEEVKNKPFASAQDCRHQRTGAMPSQNASMIEVKTQGGSTPLHFVE